MTERQTYILLLQENLAPNIGVENRLDGWGVVTSNLSCQLWFFLM